MVSDDVFLCIHVTSHHVIVTFYLEVVSFSSTTLNDETVCSYPSNSFEKDSNKYQGILNDKSDN